MHDSDDDLGFFIGLRNALLISVIGAVVVIGFVSLFKDAGTPRRVVASPVEYACISQYDAGARWWTTSSRSPLQCASAARVIPDHIMSNPVVK